MTALQRTSASTMLAKYGQTVTLTSRTAGAYNTATGAVVVTEATQTAKAVIFDFSPGLRKMAGTNIPAGARRCLLSALTVSGAVLSRPSVDDYLTDAAGGKWTVTAVREISPAGLDIIYELTVGVAA